MKRERRSLFQYLLSLSFSIIFGFFFFSRKKKKKEKKTSFFLLPRLVLITAFCCNILASSEPYHFLRCRRSRSRSLANPSCRAVCSAETRDGPRPTSLVQLLTPSSSVTVLFASTVTPPTTAEYHAARDPIAGALPPLPDSVAFSTIGEVVRGELSFPLHRTCLSQERGLLQATICLCGLRKSVGLI